jgi:hypothetical protein
MRIARVFSFVFKTKVLYLPTKTLMEILVDRKWKKEDYTVGRLFVDGDFFCNTMEDKDRGLDDSMDERTIRNKKVYSKTAIPTGRYEIDMVTVSPKFSQKPFYMDFCKGRVPRLKNVKGFIGILIHCGTTQYSSAGCIIVGHNTIKGRLTDSQEVFKNLYTKMKAAHDKGEKIFITIE